MIKVRVLSLDNDLLEEGEIDQFPFTVGRGADCDLCLDKHGISRKHLEIASVPEGIMIHDLKSTNGTFIDGRRIDEHLLKKSVKIRLGPYYIEIEDPNFKVEEVTGRIELEEPAPEELASGQHDADDHTANVDINEFGGAVLNESEDEPSVDEIIAANPHKDNKRLQDALSAVKKPKAALPPPRTDDNIAARARADELNSMKAKAEALKARIEETQPIKLKSKLRAAEDMSAKADALARAEMQAKADAHAAAQAKMEAANRTKAEARAEAQRRAEAAAAAKAEADARAHAAAKAKAEAEARVEAANRARAEAAQAKAEAEAQRRAEAAAAARAEADLAVRARAEQAAARAEAAALAATHAKAEAENQRRAESAAAAKADAEAVRAEAAARKEARQSKPPKTPKKAAAVARDQAEMFKKQRPKSLPPRPGQTATRHEEDPFELPKPNETERLDDLDLAEALPSKSKQSQQQSDEADMVAAHVTLPLEETGPAINMLNVPTPGPSPDAMTELAHQRTYATPARAPVSSTAAYNPTSWGQEQPARFLERWLDWKIGLVLQILPVGTAFILEDPPFEIVSNYGAIFVVSLVLAGVFSLISRMRHSEWHFKPHFLLSFYVSSVAVPCSILLRIYRAANPSDNEMYLGLGVFHALLWTTLLVLLSQWALRYARKGFIASLFLVAPLTAYLIMPVLHAVDPHYLPTEPKLVELISAEFSKRRLHETDAFLNQVEDDYKTLEIERAPASRR